MDDVVRDATMAGVARIVPIVTERSLVGLKALGRGHAHERWQRVAVASAKQCRRARLPAIDPPQSFDRVAGRRRSTDADCSSSSRHPTRTASSPMRAALAGPVPPAVACLVGPEGGWSSAERRSRSQCRLRAREPRSDDAARRRGGAGRGLARQLCVRSGVMEHRAASTIGGDEGNGFTNEETKTNGDARRTGRAARSAGGIGRAAELEAPGVF